MRSNTDRVLVVCCTFDIVDNLRGGEERVTVPTESTSAICKTQ